MNERRTGISNRESAAEEARERSAHPQENTGGPPPEDASGRRDDAPPNDDTNRQTAHKAGMRSIAQKEDGTRYPDRSMPPTRKKAGAFGAEPQDVAANDAPESN